MAGIPTRKDGKRISCPGNFQPAPMGGFLPAHGVPVFLARTDCKNGALRSHCGLCGMVMFTTGEYWEKYGLTIPQIRALFPMGVVDGSGRSLWQVGG